MELDIKPCLHPEKWVDLYARKMYNYTFLRINDAQASEDIVQETFLSALRNKEHFKGEASEKTWLYSILKRRIIDHYRRTAARRTTSFSMLSPFSDSDDSPERWIESRIPQKWDQEACRQLDNEEFFVILEGCMEHLPEKQAAVFRLKNIEDCESEEICQKLDITPANFWVLIYRARLQLRECLEKRWFKLY